MSATHDREAPALRRPDFGEYRELACEVCRFVDRDWWRPGGDSPFVVVDAAQHETPQREDCPRCGARLVEIFALVDGEADRDDLDGAREEVR